MSSMLLFLGFSIKIIIMKKLLSWLPFGVTITLLCGIVYVSVQQGYRSTANDPQIQMTEDLSALLTSGASAQDLLSGFPRVEMSVSLAPFIQVYDQDKKLLFSNGFLGKESPTPPAGVLDFAKSHGTNRLTWMPRPDTRSATVIKYYKGQAHEGFVLAGRSLREIEIRVKNLTTGLVIGWLVTIIASLAAMMVSLKINKVK